MDMATRSCFVGQVSGLYWASVELVGMISLSSWTLFHLHCHKNEIDCRIKLWSTIAIISMCFSCVMKCLADGYCLTSDPDYDLAYLLRYTGTALAAISLLFVLILFIIRLKITFIDTIFEISNKTYKILISLCIFLGLMFIVFVLLLSFNVNLVFVSGAYVVSGIVFLPVCVSIIYLFSARMNGMAGMMTEKEKNHINRRSEVRRAQYQHDQKGKGKGKGQNLPKMSQTVYDNSSSTDDEGIEKMSQIQLRLVKITSRYTLLAYIALFSSIVSVILKTCGIIVFTLEEIEIYKLPAYPIIRYITHQWIFFDLGINLICLILQFPFAQKFYQIYCQYCDNKCQNFMANKIASANEKSLAVSIKSASASNANNSQRSPSCASYGSKEIIIVS